MVGVRRFELLTSSVSGKRSPPELNARSRVRKRARDNITEPELGGKNIFKNRLHCGIRGFVISISKEPAAAIDAARAAAVEQIREKRRREQEEQDDSDPSA